MTTTETTITEMTISTAEIADALGIEPGDYLTGSGGYGTGFWRNELRIDLEKLQRGDVSAFCVIEDIHDTSGMSFDEYHGLDQNYKLPNGVKTDAIIELAAEIFARREDLTAGFENEWDGNNWRARWDSDVEGADAAQEYWERELENEIGDNSPCLKAGASTALTDATLSRSGCEI